MINTLTSQTGTRSNWSRLCNAVQSKFKKAGYPAILLVGGLLFSGICHAQSCVPEAEAPKQRPVIYEMLNQQLWRHETQTGKRTLVKDIADVQTVAQSVLNCSSLMQRSHDANMVVVSKTDGTVWIRGVIWDYRVHECSVSPDCRPKGPRHMLDTKGQWKQITGFKDVVKVAAGETWVVALTRSRQVFTWGTHDGSEFWHALPKEQKNHVPVLDFTVMPIFGFPAYRDVIAFHDAAYGLLVDGQVTAWADGDSICRVVEHRQYDGAKYVCPFVSPQQGSVERIWQTDGKPEECNAAFVDGQLWQWPCDLREINRASVQPIVPDQIRKNRVFDSGTPPLSTPPASISSPPVFAK